MFLLLRVFLIQLPLVWLVMYGDAVNKVLILGIGAAVGLILLGGGLQKIDPFRLFPVLLCSLIWMVTTHFADEADGLPTSRTLFLTLAFGLSTGMAIAGDVVRDGERRWTAWGLVAFAGLLLLAGLVALQQAGPEGVSISEDEIGTRWQTADSVIVFGIFEITNLIIGVIPLALPGLCLAVLLIMRSSVTFKVAAGVAVALAVYINVSVLTRTALVAAAVAVIAVGLLMQERGRFAGLSRTGRLLPFIGAGAVIMGLLLYMYQDRALLLQERFRSMGDDPRMALWQEAAELLWLHPMGNSTNLLQSHLWAHNLFLDIGLQAGVGGTLACLGAISWSMWMAYRLIRVRESKLHPADVILVTIGFASFTASMAMPPQLAFIAIIVLVGVYSCVRLQQVERATATAKSSKPRRLSPVVPLPGVAVGVARR